eukprot:scaffold66363_cov36-Phaeocystis_antarctica.AAC.2
MHIQSWRGIDGHSAGSLGRRPTISGACAGNHKECSIYETRQRPAQQARAAREGGRSCLGAHASSWRKRVPVIASCGVNLTPVWCLLSKCFRVQKRKKKGKPKEKRCRDREALRDCMLSLMERC